MKRPYLFSFLVFLSLCIFSAANADNDHAISENSFQGHIQIFGHAGFLMRLTQKQAFNVSVHNHINQQCSISDDLLRAPLLSELKLSNYPTASSAPFTLHLELIGGMDPHDNCLISYDLSLLRNYTGQTDGQELLRLYTRGAFVGDQRPYAYSTRHNRKNIDGRRSKSGKTTSL
ncbi:MAG: hypothetical protein ACNI26_13885 [Terasakiella sp.]|uniref:hypothetical protein n=1 Tax=unclassified Terasakiella TaxID=2614952 RepID=UPI003B005399